LDLEPPNYMTKRTIAALVLIETDDPRLFPEAATTRSELRRALAEMGPKPDAVMALMEVWEARIMLAAHLVAAHRDDGGSVVRYLPTEPVALAAVT
jgi:hypothetical protein